MDKAELEESKPILLGWVFQILIEVGFGNSC